MDLFNSTCDAIAAFTVSSVSNWTVDLNTWNTTRKSEEAGRREDTAERAKMTQTPHHPDKREKVDLYMMALDIINLEEVGKDKGLATYERCGGLLLWITPSICPTDFGWGYSLRPL